MTETTSSDNFSASVRWVVTLAMVVIANVATVSWMSGQYSRMIENNSTRLTVLEQKLQESPSREAWSEMKLDIREIKADVKELNKRK
jgi:uncharacterized ion transporter superfamily protein YfcC